MLNTCLNDIYISDRLQAQLQQIDQYAMTCVVAPMGYGKTTAVNWFLGERAKTPGTRVVRISVYSDSLGIFWHSVQSAFAHAGLDFLRQYEMPSDIQGAMLLMDDLNRTLAGTAPFYIFLDDYHLLQDPRGAGFLCKWVVRLPKNVHIIVASRDHVLSEAAITRLCGRVSVLGPKQLRLDKEDLAVYTRRCGADLTESQLQQLLYATEGWISAVYLNLRTLADRGTLPERGSDIYNLFTAAMIDPLPPMQQEFLTVLGLADEFTVEMAEAVTGQTNVAALLADLTTRNAFVKRLPDSDRYRCHHMMKDCALRAFHKLPAEKQRIYCDRYGQWYEQHGHLLHAMLAYRACGDYDALLRVVEKDAGIRLATTRPEITLTELNTCPEPTLKEHPVALLVLMRCMFNWHRIPQMQALKALLLQAVDEHPAWSEEYRNNLLGECDLITSFLFYNDIAAMSALHRSASEKMTRTAISIQKTGGWTFNSPSVLMQYHSKPGALDAELAEMERCMPYYYKITADHGIGADRLMRAEAAFTRGQFGDAMIALERTYAQTDDSGQENIALCGDFLSLRLSLFGQGSPRYTPQNRLAMLLRQHNAPWVRFWSSCCAYYYALLGQEKAIPDPFRLHQLQFMNFLAPGRPMILMIENQVYLTQAAWAKVIGRSEKLLAGADTFHYSLVSLYLRIQTAAAYAMMGKQPEAAALLRQTLQQAKLDGLVLPFAENYRYIKPLVQALPQDAFTGQICALGEALETHCAELLHTRSYPAAFDVLTAREREICAMVAARLSNREIAAKLFLSEGSVKQYCNRIYSKLNIEGDTRTKRRRLAEWPAE